VLRDIPAVCRFASIEPLLEDLGDVDLTGVAWAIVGGESGDNARIFRPEWAESIVRQCREQGVAPWIKQLGANPEYLGRALNLEDPKGENWDQWQERLDHLKLRELPSVDIASPCTIQMRQLEARMQTMELGLAQLAADLEPTSAASERTLRSRLLESERNLFLTRREKAEILVAYKALYGPLRKWSEFVKIVGIPRRTSYDLLQVVSAAEEEMNSDCADSAQSRDDGEFVYAFDAAVEKAVKALTRLFRRLPEAQRHRAILATMDRLGASTSLPRAA
jgi:hypothetical protein